jgi:hypothetical protein
MGRKRGSAQINQLVSQESPLISHEITTKIIKSKIHS